MTFLGRCLHAQEERNQQHHHQPFPFWTRVAGGFSLTTPPLVAAYPCLVKHMEGYPTNPAKATLTLELPPQEDESLLASLEAKPNKSAEEMLKLRRIRFRKWLVKLREVIILACSKNEEICKAWMKSPNPQLNVMELMARRSSVNRPMQESSPLCHSAWRQPYQRESSARPTENKSIRAGTARTSFYTMKQQADGTFKPVQVDYTVTPKHECILPGTLVQANFGSGWCNVVSGKLFVTLVAHDATVSWRRASIMSKTKIDASMLPTDEATSCSPPRDILPCARMKGNVILQLPLIIRPRLPSRHLRLRRPMQQPRPMLLLLPQGEA